MRFCGTSHTVAPDWLQPQSAVRRPPRALRPLLPLTPKHHSSHRCDQRLQTDPATNHPASPDRQGWLQVSTEASHADRRRLRPNRHSWRWLSLSQAFLREQSRARHANSTDYCCPAWPGAWVGKRTGREMSSRPVPKRPGRHTLTLLAAQVPVPPRVAGGPMSMK